MSNYNNVNKVLIGDGTNSGAITALPQIKKGDLIFLDENGAVISTNAGAAALSKIERVKIAAGIADGIAVISSPIQGNTVSKYEGKDYRVPAEQVTYVGYDGATANTGLTVDASTEYRLRIAILDDNRFNGQRQTFADYNYSGGASATAADAVDKIACLFAEKDYGVNYFGDKVKLERVSDGTFAAFGAGANATVTKGSTAVSTAVAQVVAVGDYIRFGGAGDTFPIYKVAEVIDTTNFVLDVPYQGDSETILVANVGIMSAQTEYGFKITGLKQDALLSRAANEPYDQYEWILFDASFTEEGNRTLESAATVTTSTKVDPGNGYWRQVAEVEEAAKGYRGDTSKRRFDDKRIDSNVVVDTEYDTIVITHADVHRGDFQDTYNAPLQTEIYIPNGADQGLNSGDNFVHILNGFFSTVLGFTAISYS